MSMTNCVTCGAELHPERAEKYSYCTRRECRERNARGLEILAVGVNKAADQYELVDGRTRAETASRADADPRPAAIPRPRRTAKGSARPRARARRAHPSREPAWTAAQQQLAVLYSARGMRPDEIAGKLGLPAGTVIQMLLGARERGRTGSTP
jgi:DNA-directed RNA polymerase specialized sigma24 family protein